MSSRSTPRPLPSLINPDQSRRLLEAAQAGLVTIARFADALEELAAAGRSIADEVAQLRADALAAAPERLAVRSLGPEHLGRWISIEDTSSIGLSVRPAGESGRLVGIRPGAKPALESTLVLMQGPELLKSSVPLTGIVRIGAAS